MQNVLFTARIIVIAIGLSPSVSSCGESETVSESAPLVTEAELQAGLDELQSSRPDVSGFSVAVQLPDGTLVSAATGRADADGRPMTPDTPVRVASITKTFVAASILRLWEEDLIDLDASVVGLVSSEHSEILESDGYDVDLITVRHLLMHASGLNDHFSGDAFRGMVLSEPNRFWTRTDHLKVMVDTTDPLGGPGEAFVYSDTGYILLGEIIERITEEPLGKAVRRLTRLDAIGLDYVWWDVEEAPSENVPHRAHQWLGEIDTYGIHGSVDSYGGGGIVASVEDIARFFSALFNGRVFAKSETLTLMIEAPGNLEDSPYRIGLFESRRQGHLAYGHGGFWGTDVFVIPEIDVTITGVSLNATGIDELRQFEAHLVGTYFVGN